MTYRCVLPERKGEKKKRREGRERKKKKPKTGQSNMLRQMHLLEEQKGFDDLKSQ